MFRFLKYLSPFVIPLILAITFLSLQAYGELALPEIMSNIVNNGISRSGIDSTAMEAIRETQLNNLLQHVSEADKEKIYSNYRLLSRENLSSTDEYYTYLKKYPIIATENIFILDTKDKNTKSELEAIIENAIILSVSSEYSIPMSDEIISQSALFFVISEYEAIGIDMESHSINYLIREGGYMLLLALLIMTAVIAESFIAGRISAGIARNLRKDTFENIISFSNTEFDKFSTASLITRSTNDIQQIQNLIGFLLRIVIYAPIMGIGGIIKVMNTEASMTWIIVLAVGIMLTLVALMLSAVIPRFKIVQSLIDKVNLVMRESLTGMLVIRAFSNQQSEEKKFEKASQDLMENNLFIARLTSLMMPMITIVMNGVSLLIIWVGAQNIDMGKIQVGDMMAFISYSMQIIMAFLMISMISMVMPRALVSAKRIAEILNTKTTIHDPEKATTFDKNKYGYIEFKNVSFKYPNADSHVLENISFTAKPCETTAIIGGTGSGKSTLVNLVPRFYDATDGIITVNGTDIKKVRQHDLRNQIGYVPQKGILFSGTIESNIKFGGDNISNEDMLKSAEISQATAFIEEKAEKYNDPISQGGSNVSGGQKQRLSIARALAKKPKIFIFDDSFSALDYKTDSMLRSAIRKNLSDSTILLVAQRIGTIKNAEQIIVLDEGKIVGKGTHTELLQNCDVYKQIALSQLSKEELDRDLSRGAVK